MSKWIELNNEILKRDSNGQLQLDKDKEATKLYFLENVNQNTVFFHSLKEKLDYLVENDYYDNTILSKYNFSDVKKLYKFLYNKKFRFESYMSAQMFYERYALRTNDGKRILERYEDRVAANALTMGDGDIEKAFEFGKLLINQEYQPATPSFMNMMKKRSGMFVSCFLLETGDSLNDLNAVEGYAKQLSKVGGGVALSLSKIRANGETIKGVEGAATGVVPFMKSLDQSARWINQLGQRQGSFATYLNVFHADIYDFLDTKRISADEDVRAKTLSIGVVIPDKFMELAAKGEKGFLFFPKNVYDEYGEHLDEMDFTKMYDKLVENPKIRKKEFDPRELMKDLGVSLLESGYPYVMFEGNVNRVHANNNVSRVKFSNLCVAPYTKILTDKGYKEIESLKDQKVNVWNGEEWSNVTVKQTGEGQEMMRIKTSSGAELDSTPYHKFYVLEQTSSGKRTKPSRYKEVRAKDLKVGDSLIKFDLPVIEGEKDLPYAYDNGLFTGDGTNNKQRQVVYLYDTKKELKDKLHSIEKWSETASSDRLVGYTNKLKDKYFVPTNEYTIASRLEWLSGYLDADGTVTNNNGSQSLQAASINKKFLLDVQLMLQTLGVESKVTLNKEAGTSFMPANDGTGDYKDFNTQEIYRILINGNSLYKLNKLGLKCNRLKWTPKKPNRECSHFIKVTGIEKLDEKMDTYCFTEPKRHMGMFNGLLTGQCSEILQYSKVSTHNDYGQEDDIQFDISCNLGSLNIMNAMESNNFEKTISTSIDALVKVSELTNIENAPAVKRANEESRSVGLGAMNLHGYLANNNIMYDSPEALEFADAFFSTVRFYALKRSMELAKERESTYYGFKGSKYADGTQLEMYFTEDFTPNSDKVKSLFDNIHVPTTEDWKKLSKSIQENGLYSSYLLATAPTGSISYLQNSTASILPTVDRVEERPQGKSKAYFPAPGLSNKNWFFYKEAYDYDQKKLVDMVATIQRHVDQGISFTFFMKDDATTADINRLQLYAYQKGIKTMYYMRTKRVTMEDCLSCTL